MAPGLGSRSPVQRPCLDCQIQWFRHKAGCGGIFEQICGKIWKILLGCHGNETGMVGGYNRDSSDIHLHSADAKSAIFRGLSNALTRDAPPSRRLADAEDTAARLQDADRPIHGINILVQDENLPYRMTMVF